MTTTQKVPGAVSGRGGDATSVVASRDDEAREQAMSFPDDRSLGSLYSRKVGRKRWIKCAHARGRVLLDCGRRYRLKIIRPVFGAQDATRLLDGVDCDQLEELEVSVPIAGKDLFDQALTETRWVDEVLAKAHAELVNGLKTRARVVVKPAVR
jgi:hypothetical protein